MILVGDAENPINLISPRREEIIMSNNCHPIRRDDNLLFIIILIILICCFCGGLGFGFGGLGCAAPIFCCCC